MAIKTGDNFSYKGRKPLDSRDSFDTILEMTSFATSSLDDGHISYCKETEKHYEFKSTNTFDTQLGYWKEYNGGTGSSTDEKVKLNNTSESKYLEELIDNSTIEVDAENGVIKAVSLDGLETTIATLNYVKNLDKDIMSYLSSIGNPMAFKGVVADDDALTAITDMVSGDTYIVQSSASNNNKMMTFIYNGIEFVPMAETVIEVRDFTTNPIDLATETTGILPKEKIDTGIARVSTTLDKSTYKGSADGVVKQADKLTGLTATTSQLSEAVTNAHKHTNKTVLDKIVSNGTGSRVWTDSGRYRELIIKDTVQPTDENALWLDITDSTKPILKVFDGTDWVGSSATTSGSSSGDSSITVDTAMSDTSTNPVQNKVIKDYVDNKAVTVSTTSDNAIENKTDGIYVKKTKVSTDTNNALSEKSNGLYVKDLSGEFSKISYAQKTINKELDYCYIYNVVQKATSSASANQNIISLFDDCLSNMEIDSDGYIKLIAGKRYVIFTGILTKATVTAYVRDKDGNIYSNRGYIDPSNKYSNVTPCTIINPTEDVYIGVSADASFAFWTDCSYISVIEIGKDITIDPLEYVNETQGIEDTPVGHIVAHMGTTAPKHYLACDGSSVAVTDYPHLAQHFKDSFGSEYYFGGSDGTMNLPDLRGEFLRGTGTNSHAEQGNGGTVGEHQDATQVPRTPSFYDSETEKYVYSRELNTEGKNDLVNVDTRKYIPSGGRRYMSHGNGWQQDYHDTEAHEPYAGTVRPTNTSVLYCIKYEHTYYMQNTYNGNMYSTDEQIVGKWIDGKPIYQKTYETVLPETTTGVETIVSIDANIVSLDKIIEMSAIASNLTTNVTFSLPWTNSNGTLDKICYEGNDDIFRITNGEPLHNGSPVYITIKYTKTTD